MPTDLPTRDEALALQHEYTQSDSLRKHMLAVEAATLGGIDAYELLEGRDIDPNASGLELGLNDVREARVINIQEIRGTLP